MSEIFNKKVKQVEKVKELQGGLDLVRITFRDGDVVEAPAKHISKSDAVKKDGNTRD